MRPMIIEVGLNAAQTRATPAAELVKEAQHLENTLDPA
jgi:hypothetical protein